MATNIDTIEMYDENGDLQDTLVIAPPAGNVGFTPGTSGMSSANANAGIIEAYNKGKAAQTAAATAQSRADAAYSLAESAAGGGGSSTQTTLNILMIGNSYLACACCHIPQIFATLGINGSSGVSVNLNVCASANINGNSAILSTLQNYATYCYDDSMGVHCTNGLGYTGYDGEGYNSNGFKPVGTLLATSGQPLYKHFRHNWDIICFQQRSDESLNYANYKPYLARLVEAARRECPNKNVKIAFHMTWSHPGSDLGEGDYATLQSVWKNLFVDHRIDLIIPNGTAIQNVRNSSICEDSYGFCYDGTHLSTGVGRYVAACTLFESLIRPYTGISIYSDTTDIASGSAGNNGSTNGSVTVDSTNRELCHICVGRAIAAPLLVTVDSSTTPSSN